MQVTRNGDIVNESHVWIVNRYYKYKNKFVWTVNAANLQLPMQFKTEGIFSYFVWTMCVNNIGNKLFVTIDILNDWIVKKIREKNEAKMHVRCFNAE